MSATETNPGLKQLSLRALLAYMVRCVRRVQPLYKVPVQLPAAAACVAAVGKALELIEQFAAGDEVDLKTVSRIEEATVCALMVVGQSKSSDPAAAYVANAAYAATCALKAAIECQHSAEARQFAESAVESALIAIDAALSADPATASAAKLDWEMIHRMRLGSFPELGKTIDPSESGILGPLRRTPNSNANAEQRSANSPNIPPQSFADDSIEEQHDTTNVPAKAATIKSVDPEQLRKLEMLAAMIRTKQKELLAERDAFEAEKQAFEQERAAWESRNENRPEHASAATVAIPVDLTAEQARFAKEREKFAAERKAVEAERAELLRERADLVQQEADLHKELRKFQEERKRQEPKEDALRALSRQQAAQSNPARVQELLAQMQEERQRLKAEKEQLAEVLALVTSGRLTPTKRGKRRSGRASDASFPRLRMILEPGTATPAQIIDLFREFTSLYTDLGGPGLRFTIEDTRIWSVAKMANRQRTASDVERSFVEVHMVSDTPSSEELNLAVWGRFTSSLCMALRLDAGLAGYFELSEAAPKDHRVWKLAADAAKRASENGSRRSGSQTEAGSGGLLIDALNSSVQRIQELRRNLESTTGLVLEILPEHEEDEEEQPIPAVHRHTSSPTSPVPASRPAHPVANERSAGANRSPNRSKLIAISLAAVGAAILVAVFFLK